MSSRSDIARLHRVAAVRQTFTRVAEARVREAEADVREIELQDERIEKNIRDSRAEIAERQKLTGQDVHQTEKYIEMQKKHRKLVLQSLSNARTRLDGKRNEWIEAQREQKIIERVEERRLQELRHQEDVARQKAADDLFIARLVRSKMC